MALNDDAVFTAALGYIYTGAVGADLPTEDDIFNFVDETTTITGFTLIGHTSRDDLPEFGYDGGDTETKGSWQKQALRTVVTDPAVDFVTFNLIQFDKTTLAMYYGAPNVAVETATYAANVTPGGATQAAFLVVIVDGENKIAFGAPKVDLMRNDAIELATDDFGQLPMRATLLKNTGDPLFAWIPGVEDTP